MEELKDIKNKMPLDAFKLRSPEDIFDEVKKAGTVLVTREGRPLCIMLSPEEYNIIKDELFIKEQELSLAREQNDPGALISELEIYDDEMKLMSE